MNWHQIGSQVVSYLIAGVVAAGPLGLAAKFYLDRSLKRLEASRAEQLEIVRHAFNKERDSRQALIGQSNYATQKALEIEFQAIQDLYAGLARLRVAMDNCRPWVDRVPLNETPEQKNARMTKPAKEVNDARYDLVLLMAKTKLFYPESVYEAIAACLPPATREVLDILKSDAFDGSGFSRAQDNREAFYPLETRAGMLLRQRLNELKRLPA